MGTSAVGILKKIKRNLLWIIYALPNLNASLYLAATQAGYICLNPDEAVGLTPVRNVETP